MKTENELILKQANLLYNVTLVSENNMGNSGNKVFEVETDQNAFILRVAEYSNEKERHTAFELKWIDYLSKNMEGIVHPQKSKNNNFFEVIKIDEKHYILCLFEKASGKIVDNNNPNEFNTKLFFHLGKLMGSMHKLTMTYEENNRKPEFEWTGSVNFWRYENEILDNSVRLKQKEYYDEIKSLPIDNDNYGIIHWDIHTDNFFVDKGNIKLFDFDACQFNWYTADIASAIFFMILKGAGPLTHKSEKDRTEFAETYIIAYLKGYLQTNTISEYWIRKIDLFIKYQMCDEYIAAQNFWPQELMHLQEWYLNWHKERITNDLPYAFVDYDKILNELSKFKEKDDHFK